MLREVIIDRCGELCLVVWRAQMLEGVKDEVMLEREVRRAI